LYGYHLYQPIGQLWQDGRRPTAVEQLATNKTSEGINTSSFGIRRNGGWLHCDSLKAPVFEIASKLLAWLRGESFMSHFVMTTPPAAVTAYGRRQDIYPYPPK
jgi:hypothetical protein